MKEKRVIRIDPTPQNFFDNKEEIKLQKKRVCAYARVSTDQEDQKNSYNAQISEYTKRIKRKEEWEFVEMYADEGISGTSIKKRPGFLKMIDDAKAGKIDMILTKSLSRFARNTVDTLTVVRELRDLNVEIFFEKENISSLDTKVDFMITIFSSIAQEESRNISENVKWGYRKRFQEGKVHINTRRFLGYDKDKQGKLIINKSQAMTVKIIYNLFLAGTPYREICNYLIENKKKNGAGNIKWAPSNIMSILRNEKYIGDALLQKTVTVDYLTHKAVFNNGHAPKYYIENNHPAIIPRDIFNLVQLLIEERKHKRYKSAYMERYPLSGLVVCASCKNVLNRGYHNYNKPNERIILTCKNGKNIDKTCTHKPISNTSLEETTTIILQALNKKEGSIIQELIKTVEDNYDTSYIFKQTNKIRKKIIKLEDELRSLIKLRASSESNYNESFIISAFEEKKAQVDSYKKQIKELNSKVVQEHKKKKRTLELKEFLEDNINLSRAALSSIVKKIIQISDTEVLFCISTLEFKNEIILDNIDKLKTYKPTLKGTVSHPTDKKPLHYKVIEIGEELS